MNTVMIGNDLPNNHSDDTPQHRSISRLNQSHRDITQAQQIIYRYLLSAVQDNSPEDVLEEFKHLFIHHVNTASSQLLPAIYEIVFANDEKEFRNTLKRSCYILINNWDISRNHESIQKLVTLFSDPTIDKQAQAPIIQRLRRWVKSFVHSKDFEELQLFASRYDHDVESHWSNRYTSYLLVPQYINLENSVEQREAARALSKKLKEKFKFDLAFYTVLSESINFPKKDVKNPTYLGDESLRLIKTVIARRGVFSYANLANIFRQQTLNLSYQQFKDSLKQYLIYSLGTSEFVQKFDSHLVEKLAHLYTVHEEKIVDDALILRTAKRVVDYLTTEDHESPAPLFLMLLSQGNPLTLVTILLKIVLMCPYVRTHLEARIADLIRYYEKYSEEDCKWVVSFFEIFNITMTIHVESTDFTLVSMNQPSDEPNGKKAQQSLSQYRIFSQRRFLSEFDEDGTLEIEESSTEKLSNDPRIDDV
ncbi:MAG: hypothetical protein AAGA75_26220 [Cyanobacteria bacterium P01_E01_bin.6]